MRRAALLLTLFSMAGCQLPTGHRPAQLPVEIGGGGFSRLGDRVTLKPGPSLGAADVTLIVTNDTTGASVTQTIPNAEVATTSVRVDPADLPGLDPHGADLQTFTIRTQVNGGYSETSVSVLLDESALPPARVPWGKVPLSGTTWTVDSEALATSVVTAWEGTIHCTTSHLIERNAVRLPEGLGPGGAIPDGTPLREFIVQGEFPRRIVLSPFLPAGVERAVLTPRVLRFVIAETAPSQLLTLEVSEGAGSLLSTCP